MFEPSSPPPKHQKSAPPEKEGGWGKYIGWAFIVIGLAAIVMMFGMHYKEPPLHCRKVAHGTNSLIAIGSCTEE